MKRERVEVTCAALTMDFSGLVEAHQRGLLALARRLVWDTEDARDVLQVALAEALGAPRVAQRSTGGRGVQLH